MVNEKSGLYNGRPLIKKQNDDPVARLLNRGDDHANASQLLPSQWRWSFLTPKVYKKILHLIFGSKIGL